jgi:hypothetical protein
MDFMNDMDPQRMAGQASELSRIIAERQATIASARRFPRHPEQIMAMCRLACGNQLFAEMAFYRRPLVTDSGLIQVTGPSVHLARELARCWTHMRWGTVEIYRDGQRGQSKMRSYAWDVQDDNENWTEFVVAHPRFPGVVPLPEEEGRLRGILAAQSAIRVRDVILQMLPLWYIEQAKGLCLKTLEHGGGVPLPDRFAALVDQFASKNIDLGRLEYKLDRRFAEWDIQDAVQLGIIWRTLGRGESTFAAEFPPESTTVQELLGVEPSKDGIPADSDEAGLAAYDGADWTKAAAS